MQDPIKRQEEIARNEYDWMSQLNMRGGPSNKNAIPFDQNISVDPERTLAFIQSICKFAKKNTQL